MRAVDGLALAFGALRAHRLRSALSMLGIAIGIAAVVLLTSIGEGTRRYIVAEFTQFGTNVLQVSPGRVETLGIPGALGGTTHKLTLDDADVVARLAGVGTVVPTSFGQARVEAANRGRSVYVIGTTREAPGVWKFEVASGDFLPAGDPRQGAPVVVLGAKLKRELFGDEQALGRTVRVADSRLRVIGVCRPRGQVLGWDMDDVAYVPVASAMRMFNRDGLDEIDVVFAHESLTERVVAGIKAALIPRHGDREDFTVMTQTAMLDVFDDVLQAVTIAVGAIGGVSLLVGAIGVLTILWIAVSERTYEIGLSKALGATSRQILSIFLVEAAVLSTLGGACGLAAGAGIAWLLGQLVRGLPLETPPEFAIAALATSALVGLVAGIAPAARAARLDPTEALRAE
jgi:putative ABC transport system permease protein